MRILLAILLLAGCDPVPEAPVRAQPEIPSRRGEQIVLSDEQLEITRESNGESPDVRRTMALGDRTALTIMCTGREIIFTFDANAPAHAFACGPNVGSFGSGGPMTVRLGDFGPKYEVMVRETCNGDQTKLTVSADRTLVTISCPFTGATKSLDGDSAFVDYVVN